MLMFKLVLPLIIIASFADARPYKLLRGEVLDAPSFAVWDHPQKRQGLSVLFAGECRMDAQISYSDIAAGNGIVMKGYYTEARCKEGDILVAMFHENEDLSLLGGVRFVLRNERYVLDGDIAAIVLSDDRP